MTQNSSQNCPRLHRLDPSTLWLTTILCNVLLISLPIEEPWNDPELPRNINIDTFFWVIPGFLLRRNVIMLWLYKNRANVAPQNHLDGSGHSGLFWVIPEVILGIFVCSVLHQHVNHCNDIHHWSSGNNDDKVQEPEEVPANDSSSDSSKASARCRVTNNKKGPITMNCSHCQFVHLLKNLCMFHAMYKCGPPLFGPGSSPSDANDLILALQTGGTDHYVLP